MRRMLSFAFALGLLASFGLAQTAASEPLIGEIRLFAGNFAPRGWALCDGQLLAINQRQALFSILGTMYGGDGRTTFGLPDLRGRVPVHAGEGPGLTKRSLGQKGGAETHVLTVHEMPSHAHQAMGSADPGKQSSPLGNVWATQQRTKVYGSPQTGLGTMSESILP